MSSYGDEFSLLIEEWQDVFRTRSRGIPYRYATPLSKLGEDEQRALFEKLLAGDADVLADRFIKLPSLKKVGRRTVRKPTHREQLAEAERKRSVPEGMDSAMPELPRRDRSKPLEPRSKRVPLMVNAVEKQAGLMCRRIDDLFSDEGLGAETMGSGWKRRIDQAVRQIGRVLDEIKDDN